MVEKDKCIHCGMCNQQCPEEVDIVKDIKHSPTYLCRSKDEYWKESKSGGVFPILAKWFLENGGYVCGCVFDEDLNPVHILSNKPEDIERMRGSKYVRSDLKNVFAEIQEKLKEGTLVLFTGTPCQVHALKVYLKKAYSKLYTMDLWCNGVGLKEDWDEYVESFNGDLPVSIKYVDKDECEQAVITTFKDGSVKKESVSEDGFYSKLMTNREPVCVTCRYSTVERQGDFTVGDLHAAKRNPELGLEKYLDGSIKPSFIIFNSIKALKLKTFIKSCSKYFEEIPFDYIIMNNRWGDLELSDGLLKSKRKTSKKKVVIYGHTENENYGGCLTYYALAKSLEKQGYDYVMIPRSSSVTEKDSRINYYNPYSPSVQFFKDNCNMAERLPYERFREYNNLGDTFILGSDMIWKDKQYRWARDTFYLNFVGDDKKKIAYATSFGTDDENDICEPIRKSLSLNYIKQFDAISCREDAGVEYLKKNGISAAHNIDPVFLINKSDYKELAKKSTKQIDDKFVLSYIVSAESIQKISDTAKKQCIDTDSIPVFISDGHIKLNKEFKNNNGYFEDRPDIYQFIWYFLNAEYVITDSFHGVCLCLLFNKPFEYVERSKGTIRVRSLLRQLGVDDISSPNWKVVNKNIKNCRERGMNWLVGAIDSEKKTTKYIQKKHNNKYKFCICSMIRNEHLYLDEWLQYHLDMGIDKIVLIEDKGSTSHDSIVSKYEGVELIKIEDIFDKTLCKNELRQRFILNWFARKYGRQNKFNWGILLDIDEYIHMDISLDEFAEKYSQYPSVHLYWKCYNANGHYYREPGTQYELYANESAVFTPKPYQCTKFFYNFDQPEYLSYPINAHFCEGGVDIHETPVTFRSTTTPIYDTAYIDHFITRSYEDWRMRSLYRPTPISSSHREEDQFWRWNPSMKPQTQDYPSILIIHYNTPELTTALIQSINKWVPKSKIYIFDNSDSKPFTYRQDNIIYLDNTRGGYIDFNDELKKYPYKQKYGTMCYGSFKHSISVQMCLNLIEEPVILLDSDVLLRKDITPLYDNRYLAACSFRTLEGDYPEVVRYRKFRMMPYLCYLNTPELKKREITFFNPMSFIELTGMEDYRFDAAGLIGLILYIHYKEEVKDIRWSDYAVHYGGASWKEEDENKENPILPRNPLSPENWLKKYRYLYMQGVSQNDIINDEIEKETQNISRVSKTPTISRKGKKVAIYTCITGGYDLIWEPMVLLPDVDFICFSDKPVPSKTWKRREMPVETEGLSDVKKQRYVKINVHKVLPEYDETIWVDGNIKIKQDPYPFMYTDKCLSVQKHYKRICIYDEAKEVKSLNKDIAASVDPQIERYREEGYPQYYGLGETRVLYRKNNDDCKKLMDAWWGEVEKGSHRDQLSFDYARWKTGIDIEFKPTDVFDQKYFKINGHIKK